MRPRSTDDKISRIICRSERLRIQCIKIPFVVLFYHLNIVFNFKRGNHAFLRIEWLYQRPFAFWQDRDLYRNINDLSVGEDIPKAIHLSDKDPCRVMTLINKVMRSKPIKMIVIGGSNSAGGGISDQRRLFHQLFLQWRSQVVFPNAVSKLTVENLSLGGTGSEFFTFCLRNFMSKEDKPDIVLIKLSANDYGY